ncbi:hypothetical protein ACFYOT_11500 [Saccharothrix saharensis]
MVGIAHGGGEPNSHADAIVRPSEYRLATTNGNRADHSFKPHTTPLH